MNKLILLGIILLGIIGVMAQEQSLGTFIQGSCVELKQVANASYCNITSVNYPNSSKAISSLEMTKSGSEFNYTNFCETSELGKYIVNGECDGEGWAYHFLITTTGYNEGNTVPIFLLVGSVILFLMALLGKSPIIGIFSGMFFIVSGIFMMIYGFGIIANDYSRIIAFLSLGLGFVIGFVSIIELAED